MGIFASEQVYADELAELLQPGEALLRAVMAQYLAGAEETGPVDNVVTFDPINGLYVASWDRAMTKAMGGVTLRGDHGSLAATCARSFDHADHLVLTTQRLMVVHLGPKQGKLAWHAPLAAVVELAHDPRLFQHGRIRVAFSDASLLRLGCGYLFPGAARRVAGAFADVRG